MSTKWDGQHLKFSFEQINPNLKNVMMKKSDASMLNMPVQWPESQWKQSCQIKYARGAYG